MAFQTLAELNTGDVLPETWVDQVTENFEVLRGSAVTTLPTGYDNAVVRYKPLGAGSAPTWMCVFDPDLNGGAGAWAVVGGGPLRANVNALQSTTSTNHTDLATAGPSVTIPAAGIYMVRVEADVLNTTGGETLSGMTFEGPGVAASSNGVVIVSGSTQRRTSSAQDQVTFTGAGTVIAKYSVGGGTGVFQRRRLAVWPIELRP